MSPVNDVGVGAISDLVEQVGGLGDVLVLGHEPQARVFTAKLRELAKHIWLADNAHTWLA